MGLLEMLGQKPSGGDDCICRPPTSCRRLPPSRRPQHSARLVVQPQPKTVGSPRWAAVQCPGAQDRRQ